MTTSSINTSVRIPDDLHARLVVEAERLDRSMGWLIVNALQGAYGEHALEAASDGETTDPQSPVTTGDPGPSRVSASPRTHGPGLKTSLTPRPKARPQDVKR